VKSIVKEIQTYQKNWKEHVERMQDERLRKLALKRQPFEDEVEVRRKSWKDQLL
jgi:hypothetical protein